MAGAAIASAFKLSTINPQLAEAFYRVKPAPAAVSFKDSSPRISRMGTHEERKASVFSVSSVIKTFFNWFDRTG